MVSAETICAFRTSVRPQRAGEIVRQAESEFSPSVFWSGQWSVGSVWACPPDHRDGAGTAHVQSPVISQVCTVPVAQWNTVPPRRPKRYHRPAHAVSPPVCGGSPRPVIAAGHQSNRWSSGGQWSLNGVGPCPAGGLTSPEPPRIILLGNVSAGITPRYRPAGTVSAIVEPSESQWSVTGTVFHVRNVLNMVTTESQSYAPGHVLPQRRIAGSTESRQFWSHRTGEWH